MGYLNIFMGAKVYESNNCCSSPPMRVAIAAGDWAWSGAEHPVGGNHIEAGSQRIGISVPTLIRLEKGDPTVSMGAYASALWLIGRVQALGDLAAPATDLGALELDVREARRPRPVRAPASISARLRNANRSGR